MNPFATDWLEPSVEEETDTPVIEVSPRNVPDFGAALVDSATLRQLDIPARMKLLGDWFAEGDLGFVFAARGVGKTWFSLTLSKAISGGDAAGPWKAADPVPVLYVDGEMPAELMQTRDRGLSPDQKNSLLSYLNHELLFESSGQVLNLSDPASQQKLTELCVERGIKVLFLDNLSCLFRGVNENDADAWEAVLPWLLDLRRRKIAVVIVAHAGRNNAMRGTSRREDATAWVIRLDNAFDAASPKHGAKFTSSFTKASRNTQRNLAPLEWTITTESSTGRCTVVHKEAEGEEAVMNWVRNGLTTCSEIAAELRVSNGTVSKMATRLIEQRRLKKQGRGYALGAETGNGNEGNEE